MISIKLDKVSRWYGEVIAVNDVSFELGPGVTGLLGPNGAGKSTLLKLMTGQIRPTQGSIRILGHQVWNNPDLNRLLGFCPERDAFWLQLTGRLFLESLLQLSGFSRSDARKKTEQQLEDSGLTQAADRKIGSYSKGMRQRLKFAQAVMHGPDIIFLDEPLQGMDPVGRRKVIRYTRDLGRAGKTIVVSSHILPEIEAMTSNILLLHHGRVLASGDVHDIRALIDEHPHNITIRCSSPRRLAGVLVAQDDVRSVQVLEDGQGINVETVRPDEFYGNLPRILQESDIEDVESMGSPDDNLASVFHYLVK